MPQMLRQFRGRDRGYWLVVYVLPFVMGCDEWRSPSIIANNEHAYQGHTATVRAASHTETGGESEPKSFFLRDVVRRISDSDRDVGERAARQALETHVDKVPAILELVRGTTSVEQERANWALLCAARDMSGAELQDNAFMALRQLVPWLTARVKADIQKAQSEFCWDFSEFAVEDGVPGLNGAWLIILLARSNPTPGDLREAIPVVQQLLEDKSPYVFGKVAERLPLMKSNAVPLVSVVVAPFKAMPILPVELRLVQRSVSSLWIPKQRSLHCRKL